MIINWLRDRWQLMRRITALEALVDQLRGEREKLVLDLADAQEDRDGWLRQSMQNAGGVS